LKDALQRAGFYGPPLINLFKKMNIQNNMEICKEDGKKRIPENA
jgi:hypothetical protein